MNPAEVPDALVGKAALAIVEAYPNAGGGYDIVFEDAEDYARHALAAVLQEVQAQAWQKGAEDVAKATLPGAAPLRNPYLIAPIEKEPRP